MMNKNETLILKIGLEIGLGLTNKQTNNSLTCRRS